jgi:hypothetical protein
VQIAASLGADEVVIPNAMVAAAIERHDQFIAELSQIAAGH